MLDLMRQANRRKWFLYMLILPVVFSFVLAIFAIWGGAADNGGTTAGPAAWIARVDGSEISVRDLDRHRQVIESQYRRLYGDQFEQLAANVDLDRVALTQLLGQTLAYNEAVRLGLKPTNEEIGEAIKMAPVFQRDGRFIGREQYITELRARGYDVAEYEREIGKELAVDKLRAVVGSLVQVGDADVERGFREEGESAEVDYVVFQQSADTSGPEPAERDLRAHYEANRSKYMTPERRRASYVLIDRDPLMQTAAAQVSDDDIQRHYDQNRDTMFTSPEQRRASHILFKVPPGQADTTFIESRARGVLEQIRGGADFAELAKANSEDSSAPQGGDLGWFGRGRMVPEFENAAFSLPEGQVSDLVKTQFGYHIIKATGSRPAGARPLEEVKDQIRQQLGFSKAQELLDQKSTEFSAKLGQQVSSFETSASELGLTVKDTGLVGPADPIQDLGPAPSANEEIFRLQQGATSGPVRVNQGILFARLVEIAAPQPAPFDTVKDRVKADLIADRAREKARAAARDLAGASFEKFKDVADSKKLEVKSTGDFTRSSAPPTFTEAAREAVFSARPGTVIGPLDLTDGVAVVKVIKHGPATPEETTRLKAMVREQLIVRERDSAFRALLTRLQREASIQSNEQALGELRRAAR
jgi:peptidyl-prolyl cis-trans isomerase D